MLGFKKKPKIVNKICICGQPYQTVDGCVTFGEVIDHLIDHPECYDLSMKLANDRRMD